MFSKMTFDIVPKDDILIPTMFPLPLPIPFSASGAKTPL